MRRATVASGTLYSSATTHGADVCDEHWGSGLDGKCLECQPWHGPHAQSWWARGGKIGDTIALRRPARYATDETKWQPPDPP